MTTRPKIQLPATTLERFMDIAAIGFSLGALLLATVHFTGLPDLIPTHFNGSGVADDYGSRFTIFILPAISLVMALGMITLSRHPHQFNYLKKITPENAPFEYRKARTTLRVTSALTALMMLVITWDVLKAIDGGGHLSILFWVIFGMVMIAPLSMAIFWKQS